ncbi:hypothetical protein [Acidocella sp. KAb 2-4]|uniref:hypothetical protein n=1 Tax=Acidocella sp. KAb 2-4 TaxID=2885158 RepID=UPI001D0956A3|nr:hypothetical protein [Acidocella sp. KAb 2-4]MCB5945545.1 hypothetical protein [Acidocella sp. KAb 2-4]
MSTEIPHAVTGDMLGMAFPPTIERLLEHGPAFLTAAFRRTGAIAPDNEVTAVTGAREFFGGGMGRKLLLDVSYRLPGPLTELFVKFPRDFGDPLRPLFGPLMEPEVRFALLSRQPAFPIRVPECYFADYNADTTSGILITERIAYGRGPVEPAHDKCLDYQLAAPLEHYRALTETMARLAAGHKAGRLGADVSAQFPFHPGRLDMGSRIPYTSAQLAEKLAKLREFAAAMPQLFQDGLGDAAFLADVAEAAPLVLEQEQAIRDYLDADMDYVALCHWNMNLDNAWFERNAEGLSAGLLDWGCVGQMNLAQAFYGMTCAAETSFLAQHRAALLGSFVERYRAYGGPELSLEKLAFMLKLAVAVLGIAWILDVPSLVEAHVPDLASVKDRHDPRLRDVFLARAQLQLLMVFLHEWRAGNLPAAVEALAAGRAP